MAKAPEGGVVGSFDSVAKLLAAITQAKQAGLEIVDVYSPVPIEELKTLRTSKRSPVRFATFVGGFSGLVGGMALALWSSMQWNLVVGGKPVTSVVPFLVVGFELTILLGGISTLLALLLLARLPNRRFPDAAYLPEFSRDRFGLFLGVDGAGLDKAHRLLRDGGACEVYTLATTAEEARA